ncbi:MAG: hypothetical protein HY245_12535 [Rhizobiales bacterium]|nr:hypothetical protein [Hyphomicrobiales bacterium]MBI3674217.1 hypothetical protein [Hyphomicrobiales bacterium]
MSSTQPRAAGVTAAPEVEGDSRDTSEKPVPTWFLQSLKSRTPDSLAEHYRARHNPHEAAIPPVRRVPPRRPMLRREVERDDYFDYRGRPRFETEAPREEASQGGKPMVYALALLAAIAVGGALGYLISHSDRLTAPAQPGKANQTATSASASANSTVISKKPIVTATLKVEDAAGALNSMIPLMLQAEGGGQQDLILKLSGLPASSYLTAGTRLADNDWQLPAGEAKNVKLVVKKTDAPVFDVAVAAFEAKTGELAAPVKEMTVAITDTPVEITPAASLPETVVLKPADGTTTAAIDAVKAQPAAADPADATQNLVTKGDILLKAGDLAMARQFYERAFAQGSAVAAIGVARTYDPVVYDLLKVQGLQPDAAQALVWYERAKSAGAAEADAAIAAVKQAAP